MLHEQEPGLQAGDSSQDSFLGSFSRVPNGLDPTQVYSYFLKVQARTRQLEEQAKQTSAPFLLEAALREATEARTQAAQAAERTYNEIVRAAQQEGDRIRADAQQQAQATVEQARASLASVEQEAERLRADAREEGIRIRRQSIERNEQDEQELERLCVDFANLLQRLLDRRKAASEEIETAPESTAGREAVVGTAAAVVEPRPSAEPTPLHSVGAARAAAAGPSSEPSSASAGQEEHQQDDWPAETSAEAAPAGETSATGGWPDDWSFAAPGTPPVPPTPPSTSSASGPEPSGPTESTPRREGQGPSGQDGQSGFRLPSWLDM